MKDNIRNRICCLQDLEFFLTKWEPAEFCLESGLCKNQMSDPCEASSDVPGKWQYLLFYPFEIYGARVQARRNCTRLQGITRRGKSNTDWALNHYKDTLESLYDTDRADLYSYSFALSFFLEESIKYCSKTWVWILLQNVIYHSGTDTILFRYISSFYFNCRIFK